MTGNKIPDKAGVLFTFVPKGQLQKRFPLIRMTLLLEQDL